MQMNKISLAIHGGAGTILKSEMSDEMEQKYISGLNQAVSEGYNVLKNGGSAIEATQEAVCSLEDNALFNAGKGSVFSSEGTHLMDACIMEGKALNAGAVCSVSNIKNPITLSRFVMEKSEHVMLSSKGAEEFARLMKCETKPSDYFFDKLRFDQWNRIKGTDKFQLDHSAKKTNKFGTVGAVALDKNGNLAAATSTGGMTNKRYGRVGDVPVIGAGTYAENGVCGISATGHGEFFIRNVVAYDIAARIKYKNENIQKASREVIENLKSIGGLGGVIGLDQNKNVVMPFNTKGMFRGYISEKGEPVVMIYGDQN